MSPRRAARDDRASAAPAAQHRAPLGGDAALGEPAREAVRRAARAGHLQFDGIRRPIRMRRRSMRSVPSLLSFVDEDAAAGDHRAQHMALDGPAVERRVLGFGAEARRRQCATAARDRRSTRSAAAPTASRPAGRRRISAGALRQCVAAPPAAADDRCGRARATAAAASRAPMMPLAAEAKGRRFDSWSCGEWSLAMASIVPSLEAVDDGAAILLAAQRRRQLGEGAVVADRRLVEREIGRRGVAGDRQRARLGLADGLDRRRGRDMRDVIAGRRSSRRGADRARP